MTPLLLDASLSPESPRCLAEAFEFDVTDLISRSLGHPKDVEVIDLAKRESRVIVTFDLDIGEIDHRGDHHPFGAILLRLEDQTVESVNRVLNRFFRNSVSGVDLTQALVVIDERRVRVVTRT